MAGSWTRPRESSRANDELQRRFAAGAPNYVVVAAARAGVVDDPVNADAGRSLATELGSVDGVVDMLSAWTLGLPANTRNPLQSRDGTLAAIVLRLGGDEDRQRHTAQLLTTHLGDRGTIDCSPPARRR